MATVANLRVDLYANTSGFSTAVDEAAKKLREFKEQVGPKGFRQWFIDQREGEQLFRAMRTAAEVAEDRIRRVNELWRRGAIDAETYRRAVQKINEETFPAQRGRGAQLDVADLLKQMTSVVAATRLLADAAEAISKVGGEFRRGEIGLAEGLEQIGRSMAESMSRIPILGEAFRLGSVLGLEIRDVVSYIADAAGASEGWVRWLSTGRDELVEMERATKAIASHQGFAERLASMLARARGFDPELLSLEQMSRQAQTPAERAAIQELMHRRREELWGRQFAAPARNTTTELLNRLRARVESLDWSDETRDRVEAIRRGARAWEIEEISALHKQIRAHESLRRAIREEAEERERLHREGLARIEEEERRERAMFEAGERWRQEVMTPLERYIDRLRELNELYSEGMLQGETYRRAVLGLQDELIGDRGGGVRLGAALEAGSEAAYSAIASARMNAAGQERAKQTTLLERIEQNTRVLRERYGDDIDTVIIEEF